LSDADGRVIDAYAARGMNGERALARIKGGMEATQETRTYWHEQEIKERMRVGDLPWSVAEHDIDLDRSDLQSEPERDALVQRDRDDPLVVFERAESSSNERPDKSAGAEAAGDNERDPTRGPETDKTPEIDPSAKPSHDEFMRMIEEQERALLKDDAKHERERDIDRSHDIDDGFGF